ncbi:NUDIX domain-containing protein [Bradyrhizobium erythrophlei]|jgi:8-oxo-dGTP diphosphatase|uniref:NUDIX domain-containing protein n=2 Tax=Bradyrhizobium erythrophlei TaxID=1437360 RepID=A0A1M7US54_9BRAD|nr:NUDIX domain-containing protein [Bradyrhizobium erythrophlei]
MACPTLAVPRIKVFATIAAVMIVASRKKWSPIDMAKSAKLLAIKRGKVLLVRRKRDRLWMFPGGRKRARENEKDCLRREISEELPKLKLGKLALWEEAKVKNRFSGRRMSDAIFIAKKASGNLTIGDKKEIDRAAWRKPRGLRLTPTSRYIRDKVFPKRKRE